MHRTKLRTILLVVLLVFSATHLLKDIAQDILGIDTMLDNFGNLCEDISGFSNKLKMIYIWGAVTSILAEIFLVLSIPLYLFRKELRLLKYIWISGGYLILFLIISYLVVAWNA